MEQQMENKYFTPDIEDLYVGYKLEIKGKHDDDWKPVVLGKDAIWHQFTNLENLGKAMEQLRVPYLTKEQIEAEGWTSFVTEYKKDIVPENMTYTFFREDRNYMLGWNFNTNKITLIIKDPSLVENYYTEPTFRGECKDINTFRKIIKLLGI